MSVEKLDEHTADSRGRPQQSEAERKADRKVKLAGIVLPATVTFVVGMLAGAAALVAPFVERDIRNRVYEATYEDKSRVLSTQRQLLKLQEEYLGKLAALRDATRTIDQTKRQLAKKQHETERLAQQQRATLATFKRRYGQLDRAARARRMKDKALAKAHAAQEKRIAPFIHHTCTLVDVYPAEKNRFCTLGYRAVFAKNTPDQKTVVVPDSKCATKLERTNTQRQCEKYQDAFLARRGLSANDVESIRLKQTARTWDRASSKDK